MEEKFTIFVGFASAAAFLFSCLFMKPGILKFAIGFSGGILFYVGYLAKKIITGE